MANRTDLEFPPGSGSCAAWLYGTEPSRSAAGRPCVVMTHGFSLTRHDGLPAYAEYLAEAGAVVMVFDHRHLGDSSGQPRQRFRKAAQIQDWRAAVAALAPFVDGLARVLATPLPFVAWVLPRALADCGGRHNLVPVTGQPGVAASSGVRP